jgi:hypothetical protein
MRQPTRATARKWTVAFKAAVQVLNVAVVATVLAALAGIAPGRTLPAAGFLVIYAAARGGSRLARRTMRRRTRVARAAGVPWGVRLERPIWARLIEPWTVVAAIGAVVAAALAAVGLPGVGLGLLLGFVAIGTTGMVGQDSIAVTRLTFETAGLRLHLQKGSLPVPWAAITAVEPWAASDLVVLRVSDPAAIVAGLAPDTPDSRKDLPPLLEKEGKIWLAAGPGGLDVDALAAAIEAARRGRKPRAN